MRPAAFSLAALLAVPAAAHAQAAEAPAAPASAPTSTLERVTIEGRRNDPTEMRRQSSAAKIVIGRPEIEQFGDSSLGDVIRRLPGVTQGGRPGRGGDLRMRGMGSGYTQILIDGERPPPGFAIEQISPDMVERIELLRAPTAETGTRAIAGTINIILREPLRQTNNDLRIALASERCCKPPSCRGHATTPSARTSPTTRHSPHVAAINTTTATPAPPTPTSRAARRPSMTPP